MARPARARIDLSSLDHNLQLARQLAPSSEVVAVVKANAYGHGMADVARHLQGVPLAVACVDEALDLRRNGITNSILVLEGAFDNDCTRLACQHDLELVIHDALQLRWLSALPQDSRPIKVWLKQDSGMHRLGLETNDCIALSRRLEAAPQAKLKGFMTHFACADEADNPHVLRQITAFNEAFEQLARPDLLRSTANSATLMQYPQVQFDQVRPGIMLYGSNPLAHKSAAELGLRPVMNLESAVMSVHTLAVGESVGYGASWTASRTSHIAQVAIGYGDGYPRHIETGTCVAVKGQRCAIAGRVSMDMISVDVTDIGPVAIGDPVQLWGDVISVDEVAVKAGTIGYELLTGVTARVPRMYGLS